MSESHTVEDIMIHQVGRGGVRIIFKSGKNWLLKVQNPFTPEAKTVAFEEEQK